MRQKMAKNKQHVLEKRPDPKKVQKMSMTGDWPQMETRKVQEKLWK